MTLAGVGAEHCTQQNEEPPPLADDRGARRSEKKTQHNTASAPAGGDREIPLAILDVKKQYLEAAFDEMHTKYGSIDNYFSEGLGIDASQQHAVRGPYLERK